MPPFLRRSPAPGSPPQGQCDPSGPRASRPIPNRFKPLPPKAGPFPSARPTLQHRLPLDAHIGPIQKKVSGSPRLCAPPGPYPSRRLEIPSPPFSPPGPHQLRPPVENGSRPACRMLRRRPSTAWPRRQLPHRRLAPAPVHFPRYTRDKLHSSEPQPKRLRPTACASICRCGSIMQRALCPCFPGSAF